MPLGENNFVFFASVTMKIALGLKVFVVMVMISYFVYLEVVSSVTENWNSTREIGFSQKGVCDRPEYTYGVDQFALKYNGTSFMKPLCFKIEPSDGLIQSCLSSEVLLSCTPTFQHIKTNVGSDLSDMFKRQPRTYFHFSIFIIVIGVVCCFLTQFYETGPIVALTPEGLPPQQSMNKVVMVKVNIIMSAALVGLLLASSQTFMPLHMENCSDLYIPQSPTDDFCRLIKDCGAAVSSVINPSDALVLNYRMICLLFAIFLAIGSMLKCMVPVEAHLQLEQQRMRHADSVAPQPVNGEFVSAEQITRGLAEMTAKWTVLLPKEIAFLYSGAEDGIDCPICLTAVNGVPPSRSVSASHSRLHSKSDGRGDLLYSRVAALIADGELDEMECGAESASPSHGGVESGTPHADNDNYDDDDDATIGSRTVDGHELSLGGRCLHISRSEVVRVPCGHVFHRRCVLQWTTGTGVGRLRRTCPVCRKRLDGEVSADF